MESPKCRKVEIRDFQLDDLAEVLQIESRSFEPRLQYGWHVFLGYACKGAVFRVIVCDGNTAGYIIADVEDSTCHIISVAVLPEYRNRGLGSSLLSSALAECQRRGAKGASLEVMVDNMPAIKLYLKFGFKIVKFIRGYYGDKDAYLMVKDFSEE